MPYGKNHKILSRQLEESVLLESPFQETTRDGLNRASVLLALTQNQFVIVMRRRIGLNPDIYYNRIQSQYTLDDVELSIFKRTRRQVIKACFCKKTIKYFELGPCKKRKIFWELWCNHVRELKSGDKKWPFQNLKVFSSHETEPVTNIPTFDDDEVIINQHSSTRRRRWTDKYLYLGSIREKEDCERPVPVDIVNPEGIRLRYLMSEHLRYWDQTEHWVQCGDSVWGGDSTRIESPASTYTGRPTSKVTYTSIITAWK